MWDFSKINQFNAEKRGEITCICGESGSGKSTLAKKLRGENTIILDGDSLRYYVNSELTFSQEDRKKNNIIAARIAQLLSVQGFDVIISTIRADIAHEYLQENRVESNLIKLSH